MKVICNRGALLEAITVAGNVVAARTPKPVLQCLKLTAEENSLTVGATDLEVAIRFTDNQVQIEQPGETLVPGDKFRNIVRESVDDTLSIEIQGDQAHIKGNDSHFKIFTQNPKEFPPSTSSVRNGIPGMYRFGSANSTTTPAMAAAMRHTFGRSCQRPRAPWMKEARFSSAERILSPAERNLSVSVMLSPSRGSHRGFRWDGTSAPRRGRRTR